MNRLLRRISSATPRRDAGASAVEYAIIVTLIAVVIIAAVVLLGGNVRSLFDRGASCTSTLTATC